MIKHIWFDFSETLGSITKEAHEKLRHETYAKLVCKKINENLKLFTHLISASEIDAPKPALEGFYKMIELSKLPAEEILYIGDHLEKDVIPAKKVGIKSGVVFEKIPEADYYFKDFKDILRFVKENI